MRILTFDVEDWFHLLDHEYTRSIAGWEKMPPRIDEVIDNILEVLDRHQITATFFCLGWMAQYHPHIIKKLQQHGHEIGSHTFSHQLLQHQSPREFEMDLEKSIKYLEDITAEKVRYFRAPGFSITGETVWALEVLKKYGIEVDGSIFPAMHSHGGFGSLGDVGPMLISYQGETLKEFPLNTFGLGGKRFVFSGGGYFRLLPYRVIKSLMGKSDYVMTYFHPRDFDKGQPMLEGLSLKRKFKSYYGLSSTYSKFEKMVSDFDFCSIKEADQRIDWSSVPEVNLA